MAGSGSGLALRGQRLQRGDRIGGDPVAAFSPRSLDLSATALAETDLAQGEAVFANT